MTTSHFGLLWFSSYHRDTPSKCKWPGKNDKGTTSKSPLKVIGFHVQYGQVIFWTKKKTLSIWLKLVGSWDPGSAAPYAFTKVSCRNAKKTLKNPCTADVGPKVLANALVHLKPVAAPVQEKASAAMTLCQLWCRMQAQWSTGQIEHGIWGRHSSMVHVSFAEGRSLVPHIYNLPAVCPIG